MRASEKLSGLIFDAVHRHHLVYNQCWEDPRLDRAALALRPCDELVVITSAGCNTLDYALAGARRIYAVDLNFRQNALLELKIAGIRRLDFDAFFELFGAGRHGDFEQIYRSSLRAALPEYARRYWDRWIDFFAGSGFRDSFYFHGTTGAFARAVNFYIDRIAKVRDAITEMLNAATVDEQREVYDRRLRPSFWKGLVGWLLRRDFALAMLGVPRPQRQHLETGYGGGIAAFVRDSVETVFTKLSLADNYFWRVYLTGRYTHSCCPEYLKRENFQLLKIGLVDRIQVSTESVTEFLTRHDRPVSRFVLLDHMDWLSANHRDKLEEEWRAIVKRATPDARVLWRSGSPVSPDVDSIAVKLGSGKQRVGELVRYHRALANDLHAKDRVHTYGSFHIADLNGMAPRLAP